MSASPVRRLERLEASLSPTERVVGWLTAAQAHPSLAAYVAAGDGETSAAALRALLRATAETARTRPRRGGVDPDVAARDAVADAVFRIELVIVLNATIEERTDGELPITVALAARLVMLLAEPATPTSRAEIARLVEVIRIRARDLNDLDAARRLIERRWLAGRTVLFRDKEKASRRVIDEAASLVQMTSAIRVKRPASAATVPPQRRAQVIADLIAQAARKAAAVT